MLLCRLGDLADPGAKGIDTDPGTPGLIVVRRGGRVIGYVNRCPHRGTPLETFPDRFLDGTGDHLICSTHGARFRVEDGLCIAGPCTGATLTRVPLVIDGDRVRLADRQAKVESSFVARPNRPRSCDQRGGCGGAEPSS